MKTIDDLAKFVDLVIAPRFDTAAAEGRLGKIERWVGARARVKSSDPALEETIIETFNGKFAGVQTWLTKPIEVSWSDLERSLGEPEKEALTVDNWGGPIPYRFKRPHGYVLLYVKDGEGSTTRIHQIIARPMT